MALLVTREMAAELNCSQCTVRRMVHDGRIPHKFLLKVGNDYRYNAPAIKRHLGMEVVDEKK